ncbi:MAG: hydrogenase maturation protease [Rhodospirillales bacterium]|nr:hydrogenase maturation protease [Rhodospirillales bacterium]
MKIRFLVLGVGNRFRRDDGVGPLVADRLAADGIPCREASGEGADLMEAWQGASHVVLIDAASSGAAAGTVHRLEASEARVPTGLFHYSSHLFSVAEAIEMARILGRLPLRLTVYGVEGRDFSYGDGLSAEVAAAAEIVEGEIRTLAAAAET